MPVIALYEFNDTNSTARDSAVDNGAQNGRYYDGASSQDGRLVLDGVNDMVKIAHDPSFQLERGTLEIQFTQTETSVLTAPRTILSRDSAGETAGGFRIETLPDGTVRISHESPTGTTVYETEAGFQNPGDEINISYSWDSTGPGGHVQVSNLSTGDTFNDTVPSTLTMNMPFEHYWIVGASQDTTSPRKFNNIDEHYPGSVEYFSLSDTVDNTPDLDPVATPDVASTLAVTPVDIPVLANDSDPEGAALTVTSASAPNGVVQINPDGTLTYTPAAGFVGEDTITYEIADPAGNTASSSVTVTVAAAPLMPDGIVEGTEEDDLIDTAYAGDPNGDFIDNMDALLPGAAPDDDVVLAGNGNDTVVAGPGADQVFGGNGDDYIDTASTTSSPDIGFAGLYPRDRDVNDDRDTVDGGAGNDTILTGDDQDVIAAGSGNDLVFAGDDNDTVRGDDGNDTLIGGEGKDDLFGGQGDDLIYGGGLDDASDPTHLPNDIDPETRNNRDYIDGGSGNDTIYGGDDSDTLFGASGDDVVYGGLDFDDIFGGSGNDTLYGGGGADNIRGGADRDVIRDVGPGSTVDGGATGDDFDTLDLTGAGPRNVVRTNVDSDGNGFDGYVEYLDSEGNVTGRTDFTNIESIVCFTPGTLIATPRGEVPVEQLRVGDKVVTRDNGLQEIRWMGAKHMGWHDFAANPHLRPVMVKAGSLGNGLPERDMMLSPNHRVLVANDRTALYFDEHEVLVAAKHLIGGAGIQPVASMGTTYIHFMCDQHEVVLSNGAWTESFQPGDYTLKGLGNAQRSELLELFPELKAPAGVDAYLAARKTLKKHEALLLTR